MNWTPVLDDVVAVYKATGLTPSQLTADRAKLRAVLRRILATWGSQDEDEIIASREEAERLLLAGDSEGGAT